MLTRLFSLRTVSWTVAGLITLSVHSYLVVLNITSSRWISGTCRHFSLSARRNFSVKKKKTGEKKQTFIDIYLYSAKLWVLNLRSRRDCDFTIIDLVYTSVYTFQFSRVLQLNVINPSSKIKYPIRNRILFTFFNLICLFFFCKEFIVRRVAR